MIERRKRFKHTTTLEERFLKYATDLQQQAQLLQPGTKEARSYVKRSATAKLRRASRPCCTRRGEDQGGNLSRG